MRCKVCNSELGRSAKVCHQCKTIVNNEKFKVVDNVQGVNLLNGDDTGVGFGKSQRVIFLAAVLFYVVVFFICIMIGRTVGNALGVALIFTVLVGGVYIAVTREIKKYKISKIKFSLPVFCEEEVFYEEVKPMLEANGYSVEYGFGKGCLKVKRKKGADSVMDALSAVTEVLEIGNFGGATQMCVCYVSGSCVFTVFEEAFTRSKAKKSAKKQYAEAICIAALIQKHFEMMIQGRTQAFRDPDENLEMLNQVLSAAYGVGYDRGLSLLTYIYSVILTFVITLLICAVVDFHTNVPSNYAIAIAIMISAVSIPMTEIVNVIFRKR